MTSAPEASISYVVFVEEAVIVVSALITALTEYATVPVWETAPGPNVTAPVVVLKMPEPPLRSIILVPEVILIPWFAGKMNPALNNGPTVNDSTPVCVWVPLFTIEAKVPAPVVLTVADLTAFRYSIPVVP